MNEHNKNQWEEKLQSSIKLFRLRNYFLCVSKNFFSAMFILIHVAQYRLLGNIIKTTFII